MRIGHLFLQPTRNRESPAGRIGHTIETTRSIEEYGFDVAVFAESHFSDHAVSPNPLLVASSVGQHTERIDLATGVLVLGLWHPIRLAEDIAMSDQLLAGRLEVCVGYGSHPIAFNGLDVRYAERRSRHAEALEILLLAWSGAEFEYHGTHYRIPRPIRVLPDPYTSPHPRITLSAASDSSIRAAAATDFKVFGQQSVATAAAGPRTAGHEIYVDERRRLGRAGDFWSSSINRQLVVVDSAAPTEHGRRKSAALQRSREAILLANELRKEDHAYENGHVPLRGMPDESAAGEIGDSLVFGTPDEVLEQIRFLRDELGITEINFITEFGSTSADEARRTIELFGAEVLPALRSDERVRQ